MTKRHYKEYYQPGNATLVIVGDIDATAALASVQTFCWYCCW
ncbi:MAG: insulinase family protein [Candidatus Obscuribacter sp.]|nr:insulinase family protein [Candidatus Obscuribacter sp.]